MERRTIIVIGASSGGFAALRRIAGGLPADLAAALFVVWHMPPGGYGVLPDVLAQAGPLPAANAVDGEPIVMGRIYVAPPDHHLLVEPGRVRFSRGPTEHRFRPAVDPLFRSAALAYGPRVIGVVLSGALDDGAAGLRTIKQHGGVAIVQDPQDAEVPSMPRSAIRAVAVDHVAPAAEMAALLARLSHEPVDGAPEGTMDDDEKTGIEVRIAAGDHPLEAGVMQLGSFTPFTCPECHGALMALADGDLRRFRCHTGHAFSADSLLAAIASSAEEQLWSALRSLKETQLMLTHMGDHFAEANQPALAAVYYQRARASEAQAHLVRQALSQHEQLSGERLRDQAAAAPHSAEEDATP